MISSIDNPKNHPIYVLDTDLGSVVFIMTYLFKE